jgi:hypothetical protein
VPNRDGIDAVSNRDGIDAVLLVRVGVVRRAAG